MINFYLEGEGMNPQLKVHLKMALILGIIGGIASGLILPYLLVTLPPELLKENPMPFPPATLAVVMGIQGSIMLFVLSLIGLSLGKKVNLQAPILETKLTTGKWKWDKKWLLTSVVSGVLVSLFMLAIEYFIFVPHMPKLAQAESDVSFWDSMIAIFYGGFSEEIMSRLGVMTLMVWVLSKLFSKGKMPSRWMYIFSIIFAAFVFGVLHLPATAMMFGKLTTFLIVRGLLLNMLGALLFGYLYWKKGLEYAMIAHLFADIVIHVIF
jgi:Type II CAAX prenyl endopeptidase Rce1-like